MIVENSITVSGMKIQVCRSRRAGGYSAELVFESGDRAVIDAASIEELESLIEAIAYPAAVARRVAEAGASPSSPASPPASDLRRGALA